MPKHTITTRPINGGECNPKISNVINGNAINIKTKRDVFTKRQIAPICKDERNIIVNNFCI